MLIVRIKRCSTVKTLNFVLIDTIQIYSREMKTTAPTKRSFYLIFIHNMSPGLKNNSIFTIQTHVDIKRKNKNFELLPKGKMPGKGKEVINSTRKLIR